MNALVQDLSRIAGEGSASEDPADRHAYAHDFWPRQLLATRGGLARPAGPRAIFWPTRDEHIAGVLDYARRNGLRVTPFGAGSAVTGALTLDAGVIAVDVKRMRTLHSVDIARGTATADAGILGEHLEDSLARQGATLGHFPSSISCSTLGGWLATRSAGQCSGRYGKIEDMAISLQGVLPTGEPFVAGPPTAGDVDARALMIGSEGLFGFITRATMRVWPAPTTRVLMSFSFATMEQGWQAIRGLYQAGLRPAVTRLYDPFDTYIFKSGRRKKHVPGPSKAVDQGGLSEKIIRRVLDRPGWMNSLNDRFGAMVFGRCLLIVVFELTASESRDALAREALEIAQAHGGKDEGEQSAARWLERRHATSYRLPPTFARGLWADTMEVSAPWSTLRSTYESVREALGRAGFVMAHMSHAYPDGCSIYFTFAGASVNDTAAIDKYTEVWSKALVAAHRGGGSISHHHGVGRSKRSAMRLELGAGVDVIAALAQTADPHGVMQQGTLIPENGERATVVAAPSDIQIDLASRLVTVGADITLASLRTALSNAGLTLPEARDAAEKQTVGAWLAQRYDNPVPTDPVDHRVAGFTARWRNEVVHVVPAPRRAAGPDLLTLFQHGGSRFGALSSVTLRVHGAEGEHGAWQAPVEHEEVRESASVTSWLKRFAGG